MRPHNIARHKLDSGVPSSPVAPISEVFLGHLHPTGWAVLKVKVRKRVPLYHEVCVILDAEGMTQLILAEEA